MLPKKPDVHNCFKSRFNGMNIKIAIKEKKADKRKEKSRVAAQIRRNKESQTLILLQNALPIGLPSPNQMLEKSIVIRIAGQTLFLLKNLDQVLGMSDWLTVPLISSNFVAFFTDNIGQIVYASPNIQAVLEQHHWSNLIGISIFDIMDFKSRWPVTGDVIKLKLLANPNTNCDFKPTKPQITSMSFSSSLVCSNYSRSTSVPKANLRSSPSMINQFAPPCSIYTVWCSTNISHTNCKLRLFLLRQAQLQFGSAKTSCQSESSMHISFPNSENLPFDRSLSWPLAFNQIKLEKNDYETQSTKVSCVQKGFLVTIHDRKYNFEAVSSEFSKVIGISEMSLIERNLLDIIHIDDIIRVKSYLDSIVEKRDNHLWTPIYRIMCNDERYCMVKTLAKQYSSSSGHSIIFHHRIIRTELSCEYSSKHGPCEFKKKLSPNPIISTNSPGRKLKAVPNKSASYIMCQSSTHPLFQKRKPSDHHLIIEKHPSLSENEIHIKNFIKDPYAESDKNFKKILKPKVLASNDLNLNNSILEKDPFLPICFERIMLNKAKPDRSMKSNRPKSIIINKTKLNEKTIAKDRFENESNCSASHSLESCVLTSPSPDSVEISIDDQFLWDFPDSLSELTHNWLDDQYQNDLELILPI